MRKDTPDDLLDTLETLLNHVNGLPEHTRLLSEADLKLGVDMACLFRDTSALELNVRLTAELQGNYGSVFEYINGCPRPVAAYRGLIMSAVRWESIASGNLTVASTDPDNLVDFEDYFEPTDPSNVVNLAERGRPYIRAYERIERDDQVRNAKACGVKFKSADVIPFPA